MRQEQGDSGRRESRRGCNQGGRAHTVRAYSRPPRHIRHRFERGFYSVYTAFVYRRARGARAENTFAMIRLQLT